MATKTQKCRAKDPSKCTYHGTALTAESMYQSFVAAKKTEKVEKPLTGSARMVDRALNCSLSWDGEEPEWFTQYSKEAQNNLHLPTTPVILDVVDSPAGPLAVVWNDESQRKQDLGASLGSGYTATMIQYKSMATGESYGHVITAQQTPESLERTFGNDEFTVWRYNERYSGTYYGFQDYNDEHAYAYGQRDLEGEELLQKRRDLWVIAERSLKGRYNAADSDLPDDETVAADLKKYAVQIQKKMDEKTPYYSVPYIDYSTVNRDLQGKGFGAALYVYTARKLAERGDVLRGSGLQTPYAETLWSKFAEKMPKRVKEVTVSYEGEKRTFPSLDFR